MQLKLGKCEFFVEGTKYLGDIRPGTIEIDQACSESLGQVEFSATQTQLRSFLEVRNVYPHFASQYAKLAYSFNRFLKKVPPVQLAELSDKCRDAFHILKDPILSSLTLPVPRKNLSYSVDTDTSDYEIGSALLQTHEDGSR